VTAVSMLFKHRAIMPIWLVVFALLALAASRTTFTMGVVLLLAAGAAQTITLIAWKKHHPALAATMSADSQQRKEPSSDVVPNSWPNSAFRNSRRRGMSGA
jgi:hypothetical protein